MELTPGWLFTSTGNKTTKWPIARAERPDKGSGTGGFISPCLYLTVYHGLENGAAAPLDSLVISNETGPDGTFLYSENPVALKVVRSAEPKIDRQTNALETEKDMVVLRDPLCRGGSSGYHEFDTLPVSGESKENNFVMLSSALDRTNPATNGHKLVKGTGCNIKFRNGPLLYHDCEATPGSSGALLTYIDSIKHPKLSSTGAPIWLAAGMNVEYPEISNNGTCDIENCNVAIDGGAILDFAEDLILADIKSYDERVKSDPGLSRSAGAPKALF